jgi:hypothetical protein
MDIAILLIGFIPATGGISIEAVTYPASQYSFLHPVSTGR